MDILLELADRLGRESVRDRLALAGVLGAVTSVEEATADGNEGIVEITAQSLIPGSQQPITEHTLSGTRFRGHRLPGWRNRRR